MTFPLFYWAFRGLVVWSFGRLGGWSFGGLGATRHRNVGLVLLVILVLLATRPLVHSFTRHLKRYYFLLFR